jgi:hypothetical protein
MHPMPCLSFDASCISCDSAAARRPPHSQVVANYSAAGLPLEAVMLDIEYMANRFRSMTYDKGEGACARARLIAFM